MKKLKLDKYFKNVQIKRDFDSNKVPLTRSFRMVVVIPVYGEYEYIGETLASLSVNSNTYLKKTLIVLVINNPSKGSNSRYVKENQHLLWELQEGMFQRNHDLDSLNLCWTDASSNGKELPEKGGVGMARKLGMDSALSYLMLESTHFFPKNMKFQSENCLLEGCNKNRSAYDRNDDPIIISLDADTLVEKNYFEAIEKFFDKHKDITAASVSFKHLPGKGSEEERAIREYEFSIRYYVENLERAGSPYAYHTIGSAMACRADAYVRAGGMKLHRGGEDFYFMQALRKLGPIMEITDTTVYQSARPSDRVPFGTGPKVQESLNGTKLKLYNSKIFDVLKDTLLNAENWIKKENVSDSNLFLGSLEEEAKSYFLSLNFNVIWSNIFKNNVKRDKLNLSEKAREKLLWAFHVWFDAFKTLKFVHYLERNYPEIYSKTDIILGLSEKHQIALSEVLPYK